MSQGGSRWPGEPQENPFGAQPRPSRLRRAVGRMLPRRGADDLPGRVHFAGYAAGSAAGLALAVLIGTPHWPLVTVGAAAGDIAARLVWRRSRAGVADDKSEA